jgi:hypothetical protein
MKPFKWSIIAAALFLCVGGLVWFAIPSFSSASFFLTDTGIGYDPLTRDEADHALALALGIDEPRSNSVNGAETGIGIASGQSIEVLRVERYDAPKGSDTTVGRQGEIYLYDYATDTLTHSVVNVATGVVTTEQLHGVQLPLTAREEARALDIIVDDQLLWQTLSDRYAIITGEPLLDMTQLQVKVSLFLGDAMPDQVNPAAERCGQHRCAQVLLFTVDRTVLEILPIVDLSHGQVIQLMSDSWTDAS